MMNKKITPYLILVILISLVIGILWSYRYSLGIQKMPNDFALSRVGGWNTYLRQDGKYYIQNGNYVLGENISEISKADYIKAFRKSLKQYHPFGAGATIVY